MPSVIGWQDNYFIEAKITNLMRQFIRYGLVGVVNNLAIYLLYLLITYFEVEPKKAMTLVYLFGAAMGFASHRKWSFAHRGDTIPAAIRYAAAHISGYILNYTILAVFVDRLGFAHQAIQAAAIIIVAIFLFTVFKYFVFPEAIEK